MNREVKRRRRRAAAGTGRNEIIEWIPVMCWLRWWCDAKGFGFRRGAIRTFVSLDDGLCNAEIVVAISSRFKIINSTAPLRPSAAASWWAALKNEIHSHTRNSIFYTSEPDHHQIIVVITERSWQTHKSGSGRSTQPVSELVVSGPSVSKEVVC